MMSAASAEAQQHYLPGRRSAPAQARTIAAHTLKQHPLRDTAQLVASELVTNAVRHSQSGLPNGLIGFTILEEPDGRIRIEVIDYGPLSSSPTQSALQPPHVLHDSGNGLTLVASLAQEWGTIHHDCSGYCTVWALLSTHGAGNDV